MKRIVATMLVVLMVGTVVVGLTGCGGLELYEFKKDGEGIEIGMPRGYMMFSQQPLEDEMGIVWTFKHSDQPEENFEYTLFVGIDVDSELELLEILEDLNVFESSIPLRSIDGEKIDISGYSAVKYAIVDKNEKLLSYVCVVLHGIDSHVTDFAFWTTQKIPKDDAKLSGTVSDIINSIRFVLKE